MGRTSLILPLFVLFVAVNGSRIARSNRARSSSAAGLDDGDAINDALVKAVDTHAGTSENQQQQQDDLVQEEKELQAEVDQEEDELVQEEEDFGQEHEDSEDELVEEEEDFDQEHEDSELQEEDFGQEDEDSELQEEDFGQEHEDSELQEEDFDQEHEISELREEDFGQEHEDSVLQEEDFGQEHEDSEVQPRPKPGGHRQAYNYGGNYDHASRGGKRYNPGLVDSRGNKLSEIDWKKVFAKLPSERDTESYKKRSKLWNKIDNNGNGYLSLAEIDRGIRDLLKLDSLFNCKPAIMRAFQAAKNSNGKTSGHSGDYVERNEFRALLEYLRKYFELYVMYRHVDSNFDGRVNLAEFQAAVPKLAEWGVVVDDPKTTFELIDVDGGGMILFDEFAAWAIPQSLALGADGPGGAGLSSAEGPTHGNYVHRPAPDVGPAVSLSLNGADPKAKKRLTSFYKFYRPDKLSEVDSLLRKYRGKERLLFQALVAKYGPEPGEHGNNFDDI